MRRNFKKATATILAAAMIFSQNGITAIAGNTVIEKSITNESYQNVDETEVVEISGVAEDDLDDTDVDTTEQDRNILKEIEKKIATLTDDENDSDISVMKYAETPSGYTMAYGYVYSESDPKEVKYVFKCYCKDGVAYIADYESKDSTNNFGSSKAPITMPEVCVDDAANEYPIVGIYTNAFKGSPVKYIKLSNSIVEIQNGAFQNSSINNVISADDSHLKYIGANAFRGSELGNGLSTSDYFKIPDTVENIGVGAFETCKYLKQILLPNRKVNFNVNLDNTSKGYRDDLTDEERAAATAETFAGCEQLSRVNYQDNTEIDILPANTFYGCINLQWITSVNEPKPVQGINFDVEGTNLKVRYIGDRCFYNCKKIASFEASETLESIGIEAFCPDLSIEDPAKRVSSLKTLILPEDGKLKYIGAAAFKGTPIITSTTPTTRKITIPGSIEKIGFEAFKECSSLEEVVFNSPDTVSDNILMFEAPADYSNTFMDCTNLKKVTLPKHLGEVPARLFMNCKSLATCLYDEYESDSVLNKIGEKAFYGCTALKELRAPASLVTISESAYEGCSSLTWVDLQYSVKLETIAKRAFADSAIGQGRSSRYRTIYISKNMKDIGQEAFLHCSEILEVEINTDINKTDLDEFSALTIGQSAFEGCTELQQVTVGKLADNLYNNKGAWTPTNPETKINEYAIGSKAFYGDENLKGFYSVVYDYGVEDDVDGYFSGDLAKSYKDKSLANYGIDDDESDPDNGKYKSVLFTIGESAFEGCKELLYAPFLATPALKEIKSLAFNNCSKFEMFEEAAAREAYKQDVEKVNYEGGGVTFDADGEPNGWNAGAPNSAVRRIGSENLEKIDYKAFNNTAIGKLEIEDIDKDKEVRRLKIYGNPEIGYNAFSNTSALAYLDIIGAPTYKEQNTDKEAKGATFENAAALKEVAFRNGTTELCSYMFNNCAKLEKVKWPVSLKKIGKAAFFKCSVLNDFNKDENLVNIEQIGGYAFANCSKLEEVYFTNCNKLTSIGEYAFYNIPCGSSKNMGNRKLVIPCTVSAIGEGAFSNTKYIEEVYFDNSAVGVVPAETISFGEKCFSNSARIETMYLPKRCVALPKGFMLGCTNLKTFYIPIKVKKFDKDVVSALAIKKICTIYGDAKSCGAAEFAKANGLNYSYDLSKLAIYAQQITVSTYLYELNEETNMYEDTEHLGTYYVQLNDYIDDSDEKQTYVGSKIHLITTVLPSTVENKDLLFYSSNERVAHVKDGVATIVGYGTSRIYAISKSETGTATCSACVMLTVKDCLDEDKIEQYTVDIQAACSDLTQLVRNVCPTTDEYPLDNVDLFTTEVGNKVKVKWTESYPIVGDGVKRKSISYDGEIKDYTMTLESEKYGDIETKPIEIKAHTITGVYLWPGNYEKTDTAKYVENNTISTANTLYYDVYVTTTEHKYDEKARFGGGVKLSDLLDSKQYDLKFTSSKADKIAVSRYDKRNGVIVVKALAPITGATINVELYLKHPDSKKVVDYSKKSLGTTWLACSQPINAVDGSIVNSIDIKTVPSPVGPQSLVFGTVSDNEVDPSYSEDNGKMLTAEVFKYIGSDGTPKDAIYKVTGYAFANEYSDSVGGIVKKNIPANIVWSVNDTSIATVKTVAGQMYLTIKKKAVGEFILTAKATKNGGYSRSVRIRVLDETVLAPRLSTNEVTIDQNYNWYARPESGDPNTDMYWDADEKVGYQYADVEINIPDYFKNLGLVPGEDLIIDNLRLATSQGRGSNRYELKQTAITEAEIKHITDSTAEDVSDKYTCVVRIITKERKTPSGTEKLLIYGRYSWADPEDPENKYEYNFKTANISVKGIKSVPTVTFTQEPSDYVKLYSTELGGNVLIRSSEEIRTIEYISNASTGKPMLFGEKVVAEVGTPMYECLYHLQMGNDTSKNYKSTVLAGKFNFKFKKYADDTVYKKAYTAKALKEPNPIKVTVDNKKLAPFTEANTAHVIITDAVTGDRITDNGLYYKKTAKDGTVKYVKDANSDDYTITIGTYYDGKTLVEDNNFEIIPPSVFVDQYKVDDYVVKAVGNTTEKGGLIGVWVNGSWREGVKNYATVKVSTVENEGPLGIENNSITLNANSDVKYNKNDEFNPSNEINSVGTKVFVPGYEDDEIAKRINPAEFKITGADLTSKQQLDYGKIVANVVWPDGYLDFCENNDYRDFGVKGIDDAYDPVDGVHVYKNPVVYFSVKPGVYNDNGRYSFKISAKMDAPEEIDDGKDIILSSNLSISIYSNKFTLKDATFDGIKFKELISEEDIAANRMTMGTTMSGHIDVIERQDTYYTVKTTLNKTSLKAIDEHLVGGYANLFESKYDPDKQELYIRASKGDDIKAGVEYSMKIETLLANGTKISTTPVKVKPIQGVPAIKTDKSSIRLYAGATGIEAGSDVIFIPNNLRIRVSPFYPEKALVGADFDPSNPDSSVLDKVIVGEKVDPDTGEIVIDECLIPHDDLGRTFCYIDLDGVVRGEVAIDDSDDGYVDKIYDSEGNLLEDDAVPVIPMYNPRKATYTDKNYTVDKVKVASQSEGKNYILVPYDGNKYYIDDYKVVNPLNESETFTFKAGSMVKEDDKFVDGYSEEEAVEYITQLEVYDPNDAKAIGSAQGRNGAMKYRVFLKPTATVKAGTSKVKLNITLVNGNENSALNTITLPITVVK